MKKLLFLFLSLICLSGFALTIPDKPMYRVLDQAQLLSPAQTNSLNSKLEGIYKNNKGSEVEILTIDNLNGMSIDEFSLQVARKWKLGQKDKDNGVLIVISKDDRKSRIEVGYGLEGVLPDGYVGALQRHVMAPKFESGNYYVGLDLTVNALSSKISQDYHGMMTLSQSQKYGVYIGIGLLVILVLFIIIISGNGDIILNLILLIINIFLSGKGGSGSNSDVGGGGGFGGGGSSSKW